MKDFLSGKTLFIIIIFLSVMLRFLFLSQIPASLNQDETAIGYNAYSLLKTGTDEHGKFLPITLESFGDWKLIGYPLIDTIPVGLFGLTEFAVRLPSALAGVIETFIIYFICIRLFRKKNIGLFASFFMAISPWSIYFSRIAYETNLATSFFLVGIFFLLRFFQDKHSQIKNSILAAIFFSATFFTYHSYIIFIPLFLVSLYLLYRKKFPFKKETIIAGGILIFCFLTVVLATAKGNSAKISTVSIFNDQNTIYNRGDVFRSDNATDPQIIKKLLFSKYAIIPYQVLQNYASSFSPSFLFDKGGEKLLHTLGSFGNFYLFDAFLFLIGIASLFWHREEYLPFLALWLFVGPIPSAITKDAPSATRLFLILPLFIIFAAYGANTLLVLLKKHKRVAFPVGAILAVLFLINVLYFMDIYFFHINTQRGRYLHYGFKQAVELSERYPDYPVVMRGPDNFPYISFLFYMQYDPKTFQKEAVYYSPSEFHLVKQFGKYSFVDTINYEKLAPKTLYIDDMGIGDNDMVIRLPSGEPILKYFFKK